MGSRRGGAELRGVALRLLRAEFCGRGSAAAPGSPFPSCACSGFRRRGAVVSAGLPGRVRSATAGCAGAAPGLPASAAAPPGDPAFLPAAGGRCREAERGGRSRALCAVSSAAGPGRGLRPPPLLPGPRFPRAAAPRSASLGPCGSHAAEVTGGGRAEERAVPRRAAGLRRGLRGAPCGLGSARRRHCGLRSRPCPCGSVAGRLSVRFGCVSARWERRRGAAGRDSAAASERTRPGAARGGALTGGLQSLQLRCCGRAVPQRPSHCAHCEVGVFARGAPSCGDRAAALPGAERLLPAGRGVRSLLRRSAIVFLINVPFRIAV